jgi:hypothetical protein
MRVEIELWFLILLIVVLIKSVLIGSNFSFNLWLKHGKKYLTWYRNREEFKP